MSYGIESHEDVQKREPSQSEALDMVRGLRERCESLEKQLAEAQAMLRGFTSGVVSAVSGTDRTEKAEPGDDRW